MLISKSWMTLSNYESNDLVKRRYGELHGREPNAAHAREMRSSMAQAREYFLSAGSSDRIVKPLLLYYGVLSLARAAIMFLGARREATLAQSHGLSAKEWQRILESSDPDLGQIEVEINKNGSLAEFADVTKNTSLLRQNSSVSNLAYQHGQLPSGTVQIAEFLSRIAEISDPYRRWQGEGNFYSFDSSGGGADLEVVLYKKRPGAAVNETAIRDFFGPKRVIKSLHESENSIKVITSRAFASLPICWDSYEGPFEVGDLTFIRDFPIGGEFSKPVATFIVSYALGMLVRYYPSHWISLVRSEKNDAALPTVLAAIDFVERYFPEMVLNFFERDRMTMKDVFR